MPTNIYGFRRFHTHEQGVILLIITFRFPPLENLHVFHIFIPDD
jgi:hypothetical protein